MAVRRGKWKLVLNGLEYDGTPTGEEPLRGDDSTFLSNLEEDPGERRNLRHAYPGIADELASAAHRWFEELHSK